MEQPTQIKADYTVPPRGGGGSETTPEPLASEGTVNLIETGRLFLPYGTVCLHASAAGGWCHAV